MTQSITELLYRQPLRPLRRALVYKTSLPSHVTKPLPLLLVLSLLLLSLLLLSLLLLLLSLLLLLLLSLLL